MKNRTLNIILILVLTILFLPNNVNAGLHIGSCTTIPGTSGGCGGGPMHDCPNMSYDGIGVHCVESSVCAIEGDVCSQSETGTSSSCSACCSDPSISASPASQNLGLNNLNSDETYYVSSAISVGVSVCSGNSSYIPTLQNVSGGYLPEGTQIIDANGNDITGRATNVSQVFIKIPSANVTKKVNFRVGFSL